MAASLPVHVWVREGSIEVAGLLVAWDKRETWWGLVAVVVDGEPSLTYIASRLLRIATSSDDTAT